MKANNRKIQASLGKEYCFYPDNAEKYWQIISLVAIITTLVTLLYIVLHATNAKAFLFLLFIITLIYMLYINYFMWKAPKLYIDEESSYLRIKSSHQNEIIFLKDIECYDYFNCYTNPLKYPFLCLCVQLFINNGQKVEFFAFMRGSQIVIEEKMQALGIHRKKAL